MADTPQTNPQASNDAPDDRITLGLLSDTHSWLDPELPALFARHNVQHILHAGDIGQPHVLEPLARVAPTTAVRGNIDGGDLRHLPLEQLVEVGDRRIAILHIAGPPHRPNRAARELLLRLKPDVLLVGHSHIPVVSRVRGALWINPGAAGREGFHTERFAALLHIQPGHDLALDRIHLGPRSARTFGPKNTP